MEPELAGVKDGGKGVSGWTAQTTPDPTKAASSATWGRVLGVGPGQGPPLGRELDGQSGSLPLPPV